MSLPRVLAILLAVACAAEAPPRKPAERLPGEPDDAYLAQVEAWRAERMASLRRPDGWLSLVALFWIEEGESTLGADRGSDLVFPEGRAAAQVGRLVRTGRAVRFEAAAEARVVVAGQPVSEIELASDAAGEPTVVEHRSLRFHVIERGRRLALRVKDVESPLLARFDGIDHYPVDPAWRLEARFEPFAEVRMIPVPDITGDVYDRPSHGRLVFSVGGAEHSLVPLGEPHDELFLVFGDLTNGDATYGGGRFLYAGPPDSAGRLVVDFNRAYNPPCVFTPYATCPLPPPGNRLRLAVEAGERNFDHGGSDHEAADPEGVEPARLEPGDGAAPPVATGSAGG